MNPELSRAPGGTHFCFRPSQVKFQSDWDTFEVVKWCTKKEGTLNQHFIQNLIGRGISV